MRSDRRSGWRGFCFVGRISCGTIPHATELQQDCRDSFFIPERSAGTLSSLVKVVPVVAVLRSKKKRSWERLCCDCCNLKNKHKKMCPRHRSNALLLYSLSIPSCPVSVQIIAIDVIDVDMKLSHRVHQSAVLPPIQLQYPTVAPYQSR